MEGLGKGLIAIGACIVIAGAVVWLAGRFHLPLGHLPGDIHLRGKNSDFYLPLTTGILLSLLLTLILNLFARFRR